jgi:gamma-glutamyltranspeptidase/glutathione hydrolase
MMNRRTALGTLFSLPAAIARAQDVAPGRGTRRGGAAADARPARTMKTLARGADYAASSLMPQSSLTAEHVLRAGGNAFDAIVAGQAVLGVVQPSANGLGSDAQILLYDAKAKKALSLNAEGTAPRLATIDWYKTHSGGKLPVDDGLLSGTVPGVVDAWYIMLSRWGTKTFAELLAPAIELAERGVPIGAGLSSPALQRYPTTQRLFAPPDGKRWMEGQLWKNPDLGRTCDAWWRPNTKRCRRAGRLRSRLRAIVSTRAISHERWQNSRKRMAVCSATKTLPTTAPRWRSRFR